MRLVRTDGRMERVVLISIYIIVAMRTVIVIKSIRTQLNSRASLNLSVSLLFLSFVSSKFDLTFLRLGPGVFTFGSSWHIRGLRVDMWMVLDCLLTGLSSNLLSLDLCPGVGAHKTEKDASKRFSSRI